MNNQVNKKYIYLVQMHSGTFPANAIKLFTRTEYSHVGISLHEECDEIYSFGRKRVHNFLIGGFIIQRPTDEFFKVFSKTKCRILKLPVTEKQYVDLEKFLHNMVENELAYKYDFLGLIFRGVFKSTISFENRYTCAQFAAHALKSTDIYSFGKDVGLVIPNEFVNVPGTVNIYEGCYPIEALTRNVDFDSPKKEIIISK